MDKITQAKLDALNKELELREEINKLEKDSINSLHNMFSIENKRKKQMLDIETAEHKYFKLRTFYERNQSKFSNAEADAHKGLILNEKKRLEILKKQNEIFKKQIDLVSIISNTISSFVKTSFGYLTELDSSVKSLNLSLGLSGIRAEILRENLQGAVRETVLLGVSGKEIAEAYQAYSDETGRASLLSEKALKNISAIAAGTGIGATNAGILVGKFEMMGIAVENSADHIQTIVDTSERMGVNLSKVMKNVNDNFYEAQKYNFRRGVDGLIEMAANSAKFNQNMTGVFAAAEKARNLEGVVEMAAKLQVLGGEFAKSNAFELFNQSRNDPDKFAKSLNSMLKGISQINEKGEFFISALDRDRLRLFAEATGQQFEDLIKQANRLKEINMLSSKIRPLGLDKEQTEILQSLARYDNKDKIFKIEFENKIYKLSDLTSGQIKGLKAEQKRLDERARASQTFDKSVLIFKDELKLALLPLLNFANETLIPIVQSLSNWIARSENVGATIFKGATIFMGASVLLKGLSYLKNLGFLSKIGGIFSPGAGGVGGGLLDPKAMLARSASIASFGVAAAGAGAGIMLAGKGISEIANSLKKLEVKKIDQLKSIMVDMMGFAGTFTLLAGAVGSAGPQASIGMLAFGGAVTLIGAGIGIAAVGMAKFVDSLVKIDSNTVNNLDGLATQILKIGAAIGGSSIMTGGIFGRIIGNPISSLIDKISETNFKPFNDSLQNLQTVLSLNTSKFENILNMIREINSFELSKNNPLSELSSLLKEGIKLEIPDKELSVNINLEASFDTDKLSKTIARKVPLILSEFRNGTGSPFVLGK